MKYVKLLIISNYNLFSNIEQRVPHTLRWFSKKWNASWEHRHNHKPDSSERAPDGLPHQIEWTVKICEIGFRCFRPLQWSQAEIIHKKNNKILIPQKSVQRPGPFCFNYHQSCHNRALLSSATSFLPSFKDINVIIHHHSTTWKMHLHSIQCEFNFKFSPGTAWYNYSNQICSIFHQFWKNMYSGSNESQFIQWKHTKINIYHLKH